MKIISFFFRYSRSIVLASVAAGIISGACNAALLAVINDALKRNSVPGVLIWSFVGLCVLLPLARFSSESLLTKLGQGAMYELRMSLCRKVLAAPLRHLENLGIPKLLATLTEDIPTITNTVSVLPILCVNAALVIGCLIYLGTLSGRLLAILLGFMAFGVTTYQLPIIKVQSIFRLARKDTDVLQGHFRALTNGIKELKIHNMRRHAFVSESLTSTATSLRRHNVRGLNIFSAAASWGQVLVFVVIGLIVFAVPSMGNVKAAALTGFTLTLLYLMTPLQIIMTALPQLARANVALQTVEELGLNLASQDPEDTSGRSVPEKDWRTLELRSVTHAYHREDDARDFVLGPINLTFEPGELVFIIGGNGSGKTTLVKLLIGLYAPEKGGIYLDGRPIGNENREFYRQHFSAVFSDFYLFDEMLGLMRPDVDRQAREYLEQLKLSHKLQVTNGKLSTIDLSQGQRKRLALVTAFLEDRPIYIFDEWAADQDPYFKNIFYTQLLPELKARNKTVIVISHDDRYYSVADRIIKLDDGQIVGDTVNEPVKAHARQFSGKE